MSLPLLQSAFNWIKILLGGWEDIWASRRAPFSCNTFELRVLTEARFTFSTELAASSAPASSVHQAPSWEAFNRLAQVCFSGSSVSFFLFVSFYSTFCSADNPNSVGGLLVWLELGTMWPRSGGEKVYLEALYPRPRFLATCIFASYAIILGFTASGCIVGEDLDTPVNTLF